MKKNTLLAQIASNCEWLKTVNDSFLSECENRIEKLEKMLPSGSGIDCGCKIDRENSGVKKVVITFDYHFLNDGGYYDGWGSFKLTVLPRLDGNIDMKITGRDRSNVKDYFYDLFDTELNCLVEL